VHAACPAPRLGRGQGQHRGRGASKQRNSDPMLSGGERRRCDRGRPCRWDGCELQGPGTGHIIPVWVGFDVEDDVRAGARVAEG